MNKPNKNTLRKLKKTNTKYCFYQIKYLLSEDMINLLNRGLNFAILPIKLDLTQVLVDYKYFEEIKEIKSSKKS